MRQKPWHFNLLASFLLICAALIPVQVAWMHGLELFDDLPIIIDQMDLLAWGFITLCLWVSASMFRASRQLRWQIPLLCVYTTVMNIAALEGPQTITIINVGIVTLAFYIPFGLLFMKKPASIIQDPEKKWWSHPERKRLHIPMMIDTPYNQAFSVSTFDISVGGAYIQFGDIQQSMNQTGFTGKRTGLKVGDLLSLKIQLSRFAKIYCKGRVVRLEVESRGEYPGGIGLQFMSMRKKDRSKLRHLLEDVEKKPAAS